MQHRSVQDVRTPPRQTLQISARAPLQVSCQSHLALLQVAKDRARNLAVTCDAVAGLLNMSVDVEGKTLVIQAGGASARCLSHAESLAGFAPVGADCCSWPASGSEVVAELLKNPDENLRLQVLQVRYPALSQEVRLCDHSPLHCCWAQADAAARTCHRRSQASRMIPLAGSSCTRRGRRSTGWSVTSPRRRTSADTRSSRSSRLTGSQTGSQCDATAAAARVCTWRDGPGRWTGREQNSDAKRANGGQTAGASGV